MDNYVRQDIELIYKDNEFDKIIEFTEDKIELAKRTNRCIVELTALEYTAHMLDSEDIFAKEDDKLAYASIYLEVSAQKGDDGKLLYTNETTRESAALSRKSLTDSANREQREIRAKSKAIVAARMSMLRNIISLNKTYLSIQD